MYERNLHVAVEYSWYRYCRIARYLEPNQTALPYSVPVPLRWGSVSARVVLLHVDTPDPDWIPDTKRRGPPCFALTPKQVQFHSLRSCPQSQS